MVVALTTPRMVKDIEDDMAVGSNTGVDDHTVKFPLACEASVCACLASCCIVL